MLCALALLALCFFQGAGINLAVFTLGWGLTLLAVSLHTVRSIAARLLALPAATLVAAFTVVALTVGYQSSLSQDNSFVPTLGLALLPMGFVLGRALGAQLDTAMLLLGIVVVGFALRTTVTLLTGGGDDALLPFVDANIYAAACYLVLIVGFHRRLVRQWRGEPVRWSAQTLLAVSAFCLFAVIFGAQSRGAMVVMAVAILIWFALGVRYRRSITLVFVLLAIAGLAFVSVEMLSTRDLGGEFNEELIVAGASIRGALIDASLSMLEVRPWIGVGIFVFPLLYRQYRLVEDQETSGLYAHNDHLQLFVEGGVIGLALMLVLAVAVAYRSVSVVRRTVEDRDLRDLGATMAVGAALAHAAITFIVYSPPLALLLGLLAASAFRRRQVKVADAVGGSTWAARMSAVVLAYGWVCFGYLVLDTYTAAVFGGQQPLPFTQDIRSDAGATLGYARLAERLNPDRGIPVFAQATFAQQQLEREPGSLTIQRHTLETYRRAARVDAWNPLVLVRFADLVASQPQLRALVHDDEMPGDLLESARKIDPLFAPAIDRIVAAYVAAGRQREAMLFLKARVMPWLDLMRGDNPEAAVSYFRQLDRWAKEYDDAEISAELSRLRTL